MITTNRIAVMRLLRNLKRLGVGKGVGNEAGRFALRMECTELC
jgi:hypothetical protein